MGAEELQSYGERHDCQCPFHHYAPEWDTGLALCLSCTRESASPHPIQEYDWPALLQALRDDTAMALGAA